MTKIWCKDLDDSVYTDATIVNTRDFVGIPLSSGRSLQGSFPSKSDVKLLRGDTYADYVMAGPMFLISERLKAVFDQFGASAEYFKVSTDTGKTMFYCNFLETIDCLDRKGSSFTEEGGFATRIERLALKNVIKEPPVYRVETTIPVIIAVSDDFADAIMASRLKGSIFKTAAEWTNPMLPFGAKKRR